MKKCPVCDKTFEDSMRFCQTDGTPLVEEIAAPPVDPYATMVSAPVPEPTADDPFKTIVASPGDIPAPDASGDLLQIPESDPLKTMYVSEDEIRKEMAADEPKEDPIFEVPPAYSEPEPEPPSFSEPSLSPPSFGDMAPVGPSFSTTDEAAPTESDEGATLISPTPISIPSPFDAPPAEPLETAAPDLPETYVPEPEAYTPATSVFPDTPQYAEPEAPASPFGQSPFSAPEPPAQMEWAPPPAPDASWQNQAVGQNTPFQPPVAGGEQSQGLAIASLVCGVLSLLCCVSIVTGPAGVIMGYIARKNANENPNEFGGAGMATAGMVTGGIATVLVIVLIVLQIFFGVLGAVLR